MAAVRFDTILVGGGLQTGLLVLALRDRRPSTRIAVVERAARLGGNHTWCFHAGDLSPAASAWVAPLVDQRWPDYRVQFPHLQRRIGVEYAAISSGRFHEVVSAAVLATPGSEVLLGATAARVGADEVILEDGTTLSATVVIDARGPGTDAVTLEAGYQKFLGLELELETDHGWKQPILMDATVDQTEGFRFVYALPFPGRRLLVEDTYFSETSNLDEAALRARIRDYAQEKGLRVRNVLREERGVLPMPWAAPPLGPYRPPLRAGYQGGWFHPGTGYSLPVAARLAELVASRPPEAIFGPELEALARAHSRQARYCRFLNRMLFQWYAPPDRWHIFERFYRMPESTIERFYALRLTPRDQVRLLFGKPPRGFSLRHRLRRGATIQGEAS